jgi:hypothetical protein
MGEVAQTMYTHVSKCKNDEIKERKKNPPEMVSVGDSFSLPLPHNSWKKQDEPINFY